jgi:pimeloyl-ACP methyl ester carboxylesterase
MRTAGRFLIAALIGLMPGMLLVTNNALHAPARFLASPAAADAVARNTGSAWEHVRVIAKDGVALDGWRFTPREPNGSVAILLHGIADNRLGMLAHASFLLRNGYSVLLPDLRGHGASAGDILTYGIKEADDIRCWADLLLNGHAAGRLYGIGQSLGAAILLESLLTEPRLRAIVADSPFASFEEIAYDRLQQFSGMPRAAFWPMIHFAFAYTSLRYGVDLRRASPVDAIRATKVPILLIHGALDTNIPPRHSQQLHAANLATSQLWIVGNAGHVASLSTAPDDYVRNVLGWLQTHP